MSDRNDFLVEENRMDFQGCRIIPEDSCIVVVPDQVFGQWNEEYLKFVEQNGLRLISIREADDATRSRIWQSYKDDPLPRGSTLVIIALGSLRRDFKLHYDTTQAADTDGMYREKGKSRPNAYSFKWNIMCVDEVHEQRNIGEKHNSVLALSRRSRFNIGLTATPLNSKVENIPMIGRALGFKELRGEPGVKLLRKLTKEMNAQRADAAKIRRAVYGQGAETSDAVEGLREKTLKAISQTKDFSIDASMEVRRLTLVKIKRLRKSLLAHFIRRTKDMKDPTGKPILPLKGVKMDVVKVYPTDLELRLLN